MLYKTVLSIIFLPIILFIGSITTYEDFRYSKIRNKWILLGLIYLGAVYLISWILYSAGVKGVVLYLIWNFDKWCVNLVVSAIVAYLLWHFKMWAAGDAKLFICYSALMPMGQYSKVYFSYYFASFLLLLAIFIPATLFLLSKSVIYLIKRCNCRHAKQKIPELIKEKWRKLNKIETAKVILGFFVLFLFIKILRLELRNLIGKVLPGQNILMLFSLLLFKQVSRFFKKNVKLIGVVVISLLIYISFKVMYLGSGFFLEMGDIFARVIIIMIVFPLFRKVINIYTQQLKEKNAPFAHWMFLGALIAWFL